MPTTKMTNQSIHHWLAKANERDSSRVALKWKEDDQWKTKNWQHYLADCVTITKLFEQLNIPKKSKIAIMASTIWPWAVIDVATVASQRILVPLYANLNDDDVTYILNHSESDVIFLENQKLEVQFNRIKKNLQKPMKAIRIDKINFSQFEISETDITTFIEHAQVVKLKDPVTIIYTSGTTGTPKGVLMAQEAIVSEIHDAFDLFTFDDDDSSLSFLPYAHVMGRVEHWGSLYAGFTLAFAQSIESLKLDLKASPPTLLVAVPRVFEKIYAGILNQVETQTTTKKIFSWAMSISKKTLYYRETNQTIPFSLVLQNELAQKLVFRKIRQAFGGRLRFAISGGAPLSPELGQFFLFLGIKVLEGYGLTETFAAIAVNTESQFRFGTVGRPIGDVEIKFDSDGEILVKSKKVMLEYYKNPKATSAVMKDGFFRTGDIGEFTTEGFLKITDRKKDLIKTSGGKYVAPQKLEGLLKQEPTISQALIIGDQRKYITALISVDPSTHNDSNETREKVKLQIQTINSLLSSYESIKKYEIVFSAWTVDSGDLTPSMKIKRKVVESKFASLIDEMYR
jgi:long-chain acyl-CoA synthetase